MNHNAAPRSDSLRRSFAPAMCYTSEVSGRKPTRVDLHNLGIPGSCKADSEVEMARGAPEPPRSSEQHCAAILATAMDAIIAIDQDHRIKLLNRAAEQLFGCTADCALGQGLDRFLPRRLCGFMREYPQGAEVMRKRWMPEGVAVLRVDGEEIPVEGTISPTRLEDRVEYTLILRDVRERVKAQADPRALKSLRESSPKRARD